MPEQNTSQTRTLLMVVIIGVVVIVGYMLLTMPDRRSTTERLGDAIHDLDKGPEKAARQLESRTPGEKIGDAVKDAGENIKRETSQ